MKTAPKPKKECHRCGRLVEVPESERGNGQRHTTCEVCRDVLAVEVAQIGR